VSTRMARQVPGSGRWKSRERIGCGAEGQHQRVPAMGRGTGPAKRRGRGDGMGAEDKDSRAETVRSGAVNGGVVAA
jgi:hypothetical protein